MKPRITPTSHEVVLKETDVIISKTDTTGRITYANRVFMRIADYAEPDLLSVQHNIVRHLDMPRGVFKFLWDTLRGGDEFFGYVKNMTSSGDFYWVFANITPDRDGAGKVVGYFSVRRKASAEAIAVIEPIYRKMLAAEQQAAPAHAPDASIALLKAKLGALGTSYDQFVTSL